MATTKPATKKVRKKIQRNSQGVGHIDQTHWSINGFCGAANVSRTTLLKRLKTVGVEPMENGLFLMSDLVKAVSFSDIDAAKAREQEAKAELKEIELREKRGELYDRDRIEEQYLKAFRIAHSRIMALANVYAARCNPSDPAKAKKELEKAQAHLLAPFDRDQDESGE